MIIELLEFRVPINQMCVNRYRTVTRFISLTNKLIRSRRFLALRLKLNPNMWAKCNMKKQFNHLTVSIVKEFNTFFQGGVLR